MIIVWWNLGKGGSGKRRYRDKQKEVVENRHKDEEDKNIKIQNETKMQIVQE